VQDAYRKPSGVWKPKLTARKAAAQGASLQNLAQAQPRSQLGVLNKCIPNLLRVGSLFALASVLCGCSSVGYYAQAVKGHCQMVAHQTSCEKLLSSTNTEPALRARLELAGVLCAFAGDHLNLPSHGAYQRYADLQRPYVVWNVYAAPSH